MLSRNVRQLRSSPPSPAQRWVTSWGTRLRRSSGEQSRLLRCRAGAVALFRYAILRLFLGVCQVGQLRSASVSNASLPCRPPERTDVLNLRNNALQRSGIVLTTVILAALTMSTVQAADWPHFRG